MTPVWPGTCVRRHTLHCWIHRFQKAISAKNILADKSWRAVMVFFSSRDGGVNRKLLIAPKILGSLKYNLHLLSIFLNALCNGVAIQQAFAFQFRGFYFIYLFIFFTPCCDCLLHLPFGLRGDPLWVFAGCYLFQVSRQPLWEMIRNKKEKPPAGWEVG